MQKIFLDTRKNDAAVRERYGLSEELMMENAAASLESCVAQYLERSQKKEVLVLCGSGNNGADGYALARRIVKNVTVLELYEPKSVLCTVQAERAKKAGVKIIHADAVMSFLEREGQNAGIAVDCIFGSGFHGELDESVCRAVDFVNGMELFRLACDVSSGLDCMGCFGRSVFMADATVTMGAQKLCLYSDFAKDAAGNISVANLGVPRPMFEDAVSGDGDEEYFLLDMNDAHLPYRKKQNVNKGSFGHAVAVAGEKSGAAVMASCAALRIGAGLGTVVGEVNGGMIPPDLMYAREFPQNTTAVACGMGFGRERDVRGLFDYLEENSGVGCVLDADLCYCRAIRNLLLSRSESRAPTVITPHPKEFCALLENTGLGSYGVSEAVRRRVELCGKFCSIFPGTVLVLKGATVLICVKNPDGRTEMYFNPHGSSALAKGGSGDVLAGLICGLLAQKYMPLDAAITASLTHAASSKKINPDFTLTPSMLLSYIIDN